MINKHPHPPHIENPKQCFALFEDPARSPFPCLGKAPFTRVIGLKVNAVAVPSTQRGIDNFYALQYNEKAA